jgi:hypothetical protein
MFVRGVQPRRVEMRGMVGVCLGWLALAISLGGSWAEAQPGACPVELTVLDQQTGKPVACRVHLSDAAGRPQRAGALPFWRDHFVCPGTAQLEVAPGDYQYEVERGPEYARASGRFTAQEMEPAKLRVVLQRLVDLAREGWWSGELHVHRPLAEIPLLMEAEDLHVAPVITWWHNRKLYRNLWEGTGAAPLPADPLVRLGPDRDYHVLAGEDERGGGALLYFNLPRPLDLSTAELEYPSALTFVAEARRQYGRSIWIDIEKPFWWDVPTWLASGQVDSIGLANNHMNRRGMYEDEAWGRPRDRKRLPPPRGNGFWTQEIYYHVLNCGLRIPPSAGSASGVLNNPVGYNRMYVQLDGSLSYSKWWDAVRAGRVFVTNGPLLRVRADGHAPGHVFTASEGQALEITLDATLTTRDAIPALEVIKNGQVERRVPFEEWSRTGSLGRIRFDTSGWFLVRAIAANPETFRFASTAPYYVEIGPARRRISKSSAQFFRDWVRERSQRLELPDAGHRAEVLQFHSSAERFWEELLAKANAE